MILRKPYGFLIKHFRLMHLIITGILIVLVGYNRDIYLFLNSCIEDVVNRYDALSYINYSIYIYILLGIGLFFIIYWLFKYKNKPRMLYMFSIVGYIIIGIYMFLLFNYLAVLPSGILDQKVIRMYRDIMIMTLGFQYLIIVIMFIRGLGFNIKKFDFGKDIHELNLSSEDTAEVEVNFNIDTTNVMREIRRRLREFGYFFQEYKMFILGIFGVLIFILVFNLYNYISKEFMTYSQNEVFGNINYITINNSYYSIGNNNSNYIIIKFDIFKYGKSEKFDVNNMVLMVDKEEYFPDKNICYRFNNLGNCYKKQYITDSSNTYILTYKVDSLNIKKSYLLYKESYDDVFKIKLDLENYE